MLNHRIVGDGRILNVLLACFRPKGYSALSVDFVLVTYYGALMLRRVPFFLPYLCPLYATGTSVPLMHILAHTLTHTYLT